MADTYTTNLNLTKPEVGASTDTWGGKINTDLDTVDAIFSATGTAVNIKLASANFDDNAKAIFGTGDDLEIYHDGSNNYIKGATSDQDIIFQGNDGGATITALTLDMSDAGAATFNNKIVATELDISGNIDVDGTTNLDVVDIDGAVDMASTLDVAGKVSLGTSNGDADYASGYSVIEIGGSGNIAGNEASNEELFLSGNAYYNSGWKYSNAGAAALVDLQNGRVRIRNAGDGSDGGAITWITSLDIQQAGDVNVAKSARITQGALTSSSNAVAWDAKAICNAYHVTTENTTFDAPTNAVEGAIISVEIAQGGTARTVAWNTVFEFAASTAPTVTATANKTDIFSFRYNGSVWQEIGRVQNLAQT